MVGNDNDVEYEARILFHMSLYANFPLQKSGVKALVFMLIKKDKREISDIFLIF